MTRLRHLCLPLACALVLASASIAAREVKYSTPGSGACDQATTETPAGKASTATPADVRPARESKALPSVHGDAPTNGRLQSPRWHSYLPGMFR
ncbi:hypothetical protein [Lysobacter sp. A3-1-A15]|uniref:hypothetical protein n=1 Tax=Novilysobacter viscosus TaxID=3098602 RepID=UPI002ED99B46